MNCFPAVKVIRTSEHVSGQVYVPFINWALLVGSIAVTCGFQTTVKLGNAFGMAKLAASLNVPLPFLFLYFNLHRIYARMTGKDYSGPTSFCPISETAQHFVL